ncbi:MAG: tRNA (adenosine(37)-N6)-threonylcarbamoyltransferase complex dimerization subunit type 1 TsaB [Gammaproteobacteria bacterium]|jgi:tRNA threonylcarbamoyladenosine biosynthesis protein TsaB
MKLIALETATEACSAALYLDGAVQERYELAPRGHAGLILPMIEGLLGDAGVALRALDAVAVGQGPGSFTGVRVAAGVAQGIAFGADLPVVAVSSLAALAQTGMDEADAPRVLAAIDARMEEVYWGAYCCDDQGLAALIGSEIVCDAADVPLPDEQGWVGVGSGWGRYADVLRRVLAERVAGTDAERYPRAAAVARLGAAAFARGETLPPEGAAPVYLRNDVVRARGK